MPIHDWTRVHECIFHSFHLGWVVHLSGALNKGLLPPDYYSLTERHRLMKHGNNSLRIERWVAGEIPAPSSYRELRSTVAVRHTSDHRIVALVEIVSPGNKADVDAVAEFVWKAEQVIRSGIHLVVIDLFPPGRHDPEGMHAEIVKALEGEPCRQPEEGRLTFVSFEAGSPPDTFLIEPSVGDELPQMPLFLTPKHYVNLPLAPTYAATHKGMPAFWREVIEGKRPSPGGG